MTGEPPMYTWQGQYGPYTAPIIVAPAFVKPLDFVPANNAERRRASVNIIVDNYGISIDCKHGSTWARFTADDYGPRFDEVFRGWIREHCEMHGCDCVDVWLKAKAAK